MQSNTGRALVALAAVALVVAAFFVIGGDDEAGQGSARSDDADDRRDHGRDGRRPATEDEAGGEEGAHRRAHDQARRRGADRRGRRARVRCRASRLSSPSPPTSTPRSTCTATTSIRRCEEARPRRSRSRPTSTGSTRSRSTRTRMQVAELRSTRELVGGPTSDASDGGRPGDGRRRRHAPVERSRARLARPARGPAATRVAADLRRAGRDRRLVRRPADRVAPTHFEDVPSRPLSERLSRLVINPVTEVARRGHRGRDRGARRLRGPRGDAPPRSATSPVSSCSVTFAIGTVVLSVLFGDVFRAFNPWRAIGRAVSAGLALIAGQRLPAPLTYPERLGRWPAAVGWVAFLFLELVWGQTGFGLVSLSPRDIAIATLVYSAYTFTAMALFGVERWIERGETFSQYFGMFASLSAVDVRDGLIRLPPPAQRRDQVGAAGGLAGAGPGRDRGNDLRRRPGGDPQRRDPVAERNAAGRRPVARPTPCGSRTPPTCWSASPRSPRSSGRGSSG